jgi:hypothetical protein
VLSTSSTDEERPPVGGRVMRVCSIGVRRSGGPPAEVRGAEHT